MPYFSIVTVCFNSAETIKETLASVSEQTFSDFEHIIVDGKSTDKTLEIITEHDNSQLHIISEPDDGIYDAMNKGLERASGEVIAILNSDDKFADHDVLMWVYNLFESTQTDVVYSAIKYFNPPNLSISIWSPDLFAAGCYKAGFHAPHPGFFAKRRLYDKLGKFDVSMKIAADFDLMMRFMEHPQTVSKRLDKVTVDMRSNGVSSTLKNIFIGLSDIRRAFQKRECNITLPVYIVRRYAPKILRKLKTGF